jgi:hypothetical protein
MIKQINKTTYAFIVRTFDSTKTIYSNDERSIEGYDGETSTKLFTFDTRGERDKTLEDVQVGYGESDDGSDCRTLWVGEYDTIISEEKMKNTRKQIEDEVDEKIKNIYVDTDDS